MTLLIPGEKNYIVRSDLNIKYEEKTIMTVNVFCKK